MSFCAAFTRDVEVQASLRAALAGSHALAYASSWDRLVYLVRERPATCAVLDQQALPDIPGPDGALIELRRSFPSVVQVVVSSSRADPYTLFRLGRAGIDNLSLVRLDGVQPGIAGVVGRALASGTHSLVARSVTPYLPAREARTLKLAFEGAQRGWSTVDLARQAGVTRPHLSVRLRVAGLPSAGHLLVWARLLLAARWLEDPGRTAESVSRQLDYSSGAAFRRTLRNYVGATPTEVRDGGGLPFVLGRFLAVCGLAGLARSAA